MAKCAGKHRYYTQPLHYWSSLLLLISFQWKAPFCNVPISFVVVFRLRVLCESKKKDIAGIFSLSFFRTRRHSTQRQRWSLFFFLVGNHFFVLIFITLHTFVSTIYLLVCVRVSKQLFDSVCCPFSCLNFHCCCAFSATMWKSCAQTLFLFCMCVCVLFGRDFFSTVRPPHEQ